MGRRQTAPDSAGTCECWAPKVIGKPVASFAPRPAQPGRYRYPEAYRPDTICDAWSTRHFTIRLASVRGYDHRFEGEPRQDAAAVMEHPATGTVVFAVADGVSSAEYSHLGSAVACEASIAALLNALDEHRHIIWDEVVPTVSQRLVKHAQSLRGEPEPRPDQAQDLLATALVAGVVRPIHDGEDEAGVAVATMVQVGDTSAWLLQNGVFQDTLDPTSDVNTYVRSSAVSALPSASRLPRERDVTLPRDGVLLIGTDGFGVPLGDGSGLVGRWFAEILATQPPPSGLKLAHALDFSRETFDDDRTLVAIWPIPEPE
jgi:serine/threonine protein phosphatase PrpC